MKIVLFAFLFIACLAGQANAQTYSSDGWRNHRNHRYHYYEHDPNRLRFGGRHWWQEMDREDRGGRR
jgi:hypothetical protein